MMKKVHRAFALFFVIIFAFTLSVPVYGLELGNGVESAEVDIYAVDTEGYFPDRNNLYLITESAKRNLSYSGRFFVGRSASYGQAFTSGNSSFTWAGNGLYNWLSATLTSNSLDIFASVNAGSYIDIYSEDVYAAMDGGSLNLSGSVQFWLRPTSASPNNGVNQNMENSLFPQRCGILANGEVVRTYTGSGSGLFNINYDFDTSEPTTNLGFRFYFDTAANVKYSNTGSGTVGRHLLFGIIDQSTVTVIEPPSREEQLLGEIVDNTSHSNTLLDRIIGSFNNLLTGDLGKDKSDALNESVDEVIEDGNSVRDEFETLDTPEPEDINPDITEYAPVDDFTTYTNTFAPLWQTPFFVQLLMLALSVAFVGYVLYGKRS